MEEELEEQKVDAEDNDTDAAGNNQSMFVLKIQKKLKERD